jgi:FlaA1/EpsC-like NDP-sugar epimerase
MEINFKYLKELVLFIQLLFLGSILSFITVYIVQGIKKTIAEFAIVQKYKIIIPAITFIVSMVFGISWAKTFAYDTISTAYAVWLGIMLWLGSTGFYTALESSNGFLGKSILSLSALNGDLSQTADAQKEAAQAKAAKEAEDLGK